MKKNMSLKQAFSLAVNDDFKQVLKSATVIANIEFEDPATCNRTDLMFDNQLIKINTFINI